MVKKFLFFDIDGTLVNFDGVLPESAKRALLAVRERGNQIFLCTGRSKCQIESRLWNFGFDGIVAAAGAYVEYEGRVLNNSHMSESQVARLLHFFEGQQAVYMVQCTDKIVTTRRCADAMREQFLRERPGDEERVKKILANQVVDEAILDHLSCYPNVEKLCYHSANIPLAEVTRELVPEFSVTAMSYDRMDAGGEIGIAGVTKASGMQILLDVAGAAREDTIAFGDGPNDFEMLDFAGTGVAMGNASEDLKRHADMVTTHINEDGIYQGMVKLGLL